MSRKENAEEKINYGYGYDESNSIAIIWCIDDVRKVLEDYESFDCLDLSDDDCLEVLGSIENNHDANYGISWDTIYYTLCELYDEEIKEAKEKDEV